MNIQAVRYIFTAYASIFMTQIDIYYKLEYWNINASDYKKEGKKDGNNVSESNFNLNISNVTDCLRETYFVKGLKIIFYLFK